jgi:predicted GIY-YIG superfamily endonuclease
MPQRTYFVYVMSSHSRLDTGVTNDLERRVATAEKEPGFYARYA